ncbi:MAG: hypothetical protein ACOC45_04180 [Alkalispirochaetaceae bacterium]
MPSALEKLIIPPCRTLASADWYRFLARKIRYTVEKQNRAC